MKITYFISIITLLLVGCSSIKKELIQAGSRHEAIQNAILEFSNAGSLFRRDSVFSLSFQDTLGRMVLDKIDERNYRWINGEIYEGIMGVGILPTYNQFLLTAGTTVGSKGKLPSRFIEKNGKLIYWWDDEYPLTEEALAIFKKYNLLQDDEGGIITFPEFATDDAQKAVHYYFCRNDLSKYKKVITNKGMGYYDPPKLKCSP